jgi:GntR family transcriptional regulator
MRKATDEPFALETCYLSAQEFPDLVAASLERGSLFSTLEHQYGIELAYADEEIDVTAADLKTTELLAVPRGSRFFAFAS